MPRYNDQHITADAFLADLASGPDELSCRDCTIVGEVNISNSPLRPNADGNYPVRIPVTCQNCKFTEPVDFTNAEFHKRAEFTGSAFHNDAKFSAIFHGIARFNNISFGPVTTDTSQRPPRMTFTAAVFKDRAEFQGIQAEQQYIGFSDTQFKGSTKFNRTDFSSTNFEGAEFHQDTDFTDTHFRDDPVFSGAQFYKKATFTNSRFYREATFTEAQFLEDANFQAAKFDEEARFDKANFAKSGDFHSAKFGKSVDFKDVKYKENRIRHFKNYTRFILESAKIDEVTNPLFKRYIADLQYIESYKNKHPWIALIWQWTSDYGRSLLLWGIWSALIAVVFACAYGHDVVGSYLKSNSAIELISDLIRLIWVPMIVGIVIYLLEKLKKKLKRLENLKKLPHFIQGVTIAGLLALFLIYALPTVSELSFTTDNTSSDNSSREKTAPFITYLYFSVVTFTTLGFGDVTPITHVSEVWLMTEVTLGYIMLGGLLSIFANKLARRS